MLIVVLKLPNVKQKTEVRPKACPYCEGDTFQRWGQVSKPVKDIRVRNVRVYRYRCCQCKRTFRHYPAGNRRAEQTERLRVFAIVLWRLGLSHRASSLILSGLQVFVSHMLIWRDVQAEAQTITKRNQWKPVRIVGLDGAYVLGWGTKQPVLVAVDLGTGETLAPTPSAVCFGADNAPQHDILFLSMIDVMLAVGIVVAAFAARFPAGRGGTRL